MKKVLLFLLPCVLVLFFPQISLAHGGVEKRAGNILVTLFQTPLSPLVGEKVGFSFILTDPSKNNILKNKSAQVVVTETTTGDPSKDKVVFTKKVTSDVNGTINFSYAFPKTNYYDIDLEFGKPHDEANTTGFLVQPRRIDDHLLVIVSIFLAVSIFINFLFTFVRLKKYRGKKKMLGA